MDRPEFLRMKLSNFPGYVIEEYNWKKIVDKNGFLFIRVEKGIYGLPHAGIIAQKLLEEILEKHGYRQGDKTPGFWKHDTRPICFSLIVDDFGVKYACEEHANRLIYCGIILDWDYTTHKVHLTVC